MYLLRLKRGGEHVIWASCTITVISWLITRYLPEGNVSQTFDLGSG